ncbi:MAG: hypothetical protein N2A99_06410 [Carnobacterium alterfunditum]
MEKLPAIILSILAVILFMGVMIFNGIGPAMDTKTDGVITEMNDQDFTGTP